MHHEKRQPIDGDSDQLRQETVRKVTDYLIHLEKDQETPAKVIEKKKTAVPIWRSTIKNNARQQAVRKMVKDDEDRNILR